MAIRNSCVASIDWGLKRFEDLLHHFGHDSGNHGSMLKVFCPLKLYLYLQCDPPSRLQVNAFNLFQSTLSTTHRFGSMRKLMRNLCEDGTDASQGKGQIISNINACQAAGGLR